jgi:phage baseplate assembly protein W
MTANFLGSGWPFPIRATPAGQVALVAGDEKIRQSIWLILSTAPGERRMRPEFGCGIHDLVFESNTASLRGLVQQRVQVALTTWEPRIDVLTVRVEAPPEARNELRIRVDYRVRATNSVNNLVYPFFLSEGAA